MRFISLAVLATAMSLSTTVTAAGESCPAFTYRKSVNDVTPDEWAIITQTIRASATTPDPSNNGLSIWETAAELHNSLATVVHGNCNFLYFHRIFLTWMERRLQAINPGFFFPYWSSAADWANPAMSPVWNYLGHGNGVVPDGPLAGVTFKSTGSGLIRNFNWPNLAIPLPSLEMYSQTFSDSVTSGLGFSDYAPKLETLHGSIHVAIGGNSYGQMFTMRSPLDCMFYFHHSFIDYTWFQAQNGWVAAGMGINAQVGYVDQNNVTCTLNNVIPAFQSTFADVLDVSSLCVRYLNPGEAPPTQTQTTTTTAAPTTTTTTMAPTTTTTSMTLTTTTDSLTFPNLFGGSSTTDSTSSTSSSSTSTTISETSTGTSTGTATGSTKMPLSYGSTTTVPSQYPYPSSTTTSAAFNSANLGSTASSYGVPTDNGYGVPTTTTTTTAAIPNLATTSSSSTASAPSSTSAYESLMDKINKNYRPYTGMTYPKNYTQLSACPPPLPQQWVNNNLKSPLAQSAVQAVDQTCMRVLETIKTGGTIPPPPRFVDDGERPHLAQDAPKGTNVSTVVVPQINPASGFNITAAIPIMSSSAQSAKTMGVHAGMSIVAAVVMGATALIGF